MSRVGDAVSSGYSSPASGMREHLPLLSLTERWEVALGWRCASCHRSARSMTSRVHALPPSGVGSPGSRIP
ncbi:hypothetical protein E4K10_22855 [Streptomyces sp. T1317-0309]|nr:hypothetical protein E4K10_22855 [Streptomyces sp. T1317-0309]